MRDLSLNLVIVICALCFAFLFGEIFVRIFYPQGEAMDWIQSDARYGYILKKNFQRKVSFPRSDVTMDVKINSLGLRGQEYSIADLFNPNIKKILLIGDSFTFGQGVNIEDTFGEKLERLLLQSHKDYIVLNAGVSGWGTLQETMYARESFNLFNPDIIVLTFCGNDPGDDFLFQRGLSDSEKGIVGSFPGKAFLRQHSQLYQFLFRQFRIIFHNMRLKKQLADHPEENVDAQSASLITESEWKETFKQINSFHNDFLKFNPDGVLLLQASASWDRSTREHLRMLSNGKSLIYVDLYDDTISLSPEQRRLPYDGHWSQQMHVISAKRLYQAIIEPESTGKH